MLLVASARCASEGSVVVVAGIPQEAATLETALAVEGAPAADSPAIDLGPFGGKSELSFALRFPADRSGALHVAARALGADGCVLAFGTNPAGDSTGSSTVKVPLSPLPAPDCARQVPRLLRASPESATAGTPVTLGGWGLRPGARAYIYEGTLPKQPTPLPADWRSPAELAVPMPTLPAGAQRAVMVRVENPDGSEDTRGDLLTYFSATGDRTCCPGLCSNGCAEDCLFYLQSDPMHCGGCTTACAKDRATCVNSECKCGAGPPCTTGVCLNGSCVACARNSDCAQGQFCANNRCLPCDKDDQCGLSCSNCRASDKYCRPGDGGAPATCVECVEDRHCPSGICDMVRNRCGVCRDDTICRNIGAYYCDATLHCIGCVYFHHCGPSCVACATPTPYCAGQSRGCVECYGANSCAGSPKGSLCGANNTCGCSNDTHCPSGKTCNTTTKVCNP